MLTETPDGLYCEDGGFHVDPWGAVPLAIVLVGRQSAAGPLVGAGIGDDANQVLQVEA